MFASKGIDLHFPAMNLRLLDSSELKTYILKYKLNIYAIRKLPTKRNNSNRQNLFVTNNLLSVNGVP